MIVSSLLLKAHFPSPWRKFMSVLKVLGAAGCVFNFGSLPFNAQLILIIALASLKCSDSWRRSDCGEREALEVSISA